MLLAALVLAGLSAVPAAAAPPPSTTTTTPIEHVVWLMQDNHSFDNYFGTYPGADGIPPGVCQKLSLNRSSTKGCVQPFHLRDAPPEDLSQGPGVQRRQYDGGKMDGFVAAYRRLGQDGSSAMGYYDGSDIPFHWNVADQYVLFDRFFASTAVGARESYLYWVAGRAPAGPTPVRTNNGYDSLPTVFDRLAQRHVSAKFYVENLDSAVTGKGWPKAARSSQQIKVPLLSMRRFRDGGALEGQIVDLQQYYVDVRNGTLPAVSYVVTSGSSENPPASPAAGSRMLRKLTTELMKSSYWDSSALMWTYDGWGGWYDHVPPPQVDQHGYGFRVPALLVSPYAKRGVVDHTVLDYTAMLKFIEQNWQLKPLSSRDAGSAGLMSAFDFAAGPRPAALVPASWPAEAAARQATHPATVIYASYGSAAALVALILSLVALTRRPLGLALPAGLRSRVGDVQPLGDLVRGREWWRSEQVTRFLGRGVLPSVSVDGPQTWAEWYRSTRATASGESDPGSGSRAVRRLGLARGAGDLKIREVSTDGGLTWAEWCSTRQGPGAHLASADGLTAEAVPGNQPGHRWDSRFDRLSRAGAVSIDADTSWAEWYRSKHAGVAGAPDGER